MVAEGKVQLAAMVRVTSELFRSVAVISTALLAGKIDAILYALLVFSGGRCIFQWFYLKNNYRFSLKHIDFSFWRQQIGYSIPLGISNVVWLLQLKLHNYFVTFLFTPATYAIYAIGTYNLPFLNLITTSVSNIMVPALAKAQKEGDITKILTIWQNAMKKMNLIFYPMFVFFFIMAHEFITLIFSTAYADSVPIFRVSLLGLLVAGINNGAILNSFAETRFQMNVAFLRLPVTILVLYLFTTNWNLIGAVTANVTIVFLFVFLVALKVRRVLNVSITNLLQLKMNMMIFGAAFLAGMPLMLLKNTMNYQPLLLLSVSIPVFISAYCLSALALRVIIPSDLLAFVQIVSNRLNPVKKSI
jgi:O-antigen/teichoic acid export membrane protein